MYSPKKSSFFSQSFIQLFHVFNSEWILVLLGQFIFAHSIGFAICKITVLRIANAYIHGVRIANPNERNERML